jgi:hypothetical protein
LIEKERQVIKIVIGRRYGIRKNGLKMVKHLKRVLTIP